jgi:hypothetical protein
VNAGLTELQRWKVRRARYIHGSWEQEFGAQIALGRSEREALAWVFGATRERLGDMLGLVDELNGEQR